MTPLEFIRKTVSLQRIVTAINDTTEYTAEDLAGAYAVYCDQEGDAGLEEHLEDFLNQLEEAGAEFDYAEALSIAENLK